MGVGVHGYRYISVAQALLRHLGVNALREHQGGAGVAQVVKANVRQSCPLQERFEGAVDEILGIYGCADGGGEHKGVVLVACAEDELLLRLELPVLLEDFRGLGAEPDGASFRVLGRQEGEAGSVAHPLELSGNT